MMGKNTIMRRIQVYLRGGLRGMHESDESKTRTEPESESQKPFTSSQPAIALEDSHYHSATN